NTEENKIITSEGEFSYDYLVLATGATTNFFGNKNLEDWTYTMKSTLEAVNIRQRLLLNFEDALEAEGEERDALLNFIIVGGGPTGVELAGALGEMKKHVFPKDYPEIDFGKMHITLLEGSSKTLGTMSEISSKKSRQYLEELGVTVMTGTQVKDYDGVNVVLKDDTKMRSGMVIWAAGVKGN